jgi:hypothetical protein
MSASSSSERSTVAGGSEAVIDEGGEGEGTGEEEGTGGEEVGDDAEGESTFMGTLGGEEVG